MTRTCPREFLDTTARLPLASMPCDRQGLILLVVFGWFVCSCDKPPPPTEAECRASMERSLELLAWARFYSVSPIGKFEYHVRRSDARVEAQVCIAEARKYYSARVN